MISSQEAMVAAMSMAMAKPPMAASAEAWTIVIPWLFLDAQQKLQLLSSSKSTANKNLKVLLEYGPDTASFWKL